MLNACHRLGQGACKAQSGDQSTGIRQQIAHARRAIIGDKYPGEFKLKGRGLMRGIEATHADVTGPITKRAFEHGLIIETSGPNDEVIKCLMPLTTSEEDLKKGAELLARSVDEIMQEGISKAS